MGIHGILKHLGPGKRTSLATLSARHYIKHDRPLRLAIDIAIWLFQIQAGQGGSNPALRTFYYRLLRLISLNIHPLFVFDGPNKPLFKRNKRVGGPGVRVATVPEFLAKQLLKQFGFPMHNAPGEAEAECALLQREGVVDAVLSDDVDTMMFGSSLTLRNWTAEGTTKSPTHVDVYQAADVKAASGLDREGMILVAMMSGGDYIPEGIPGCGPKLAVDAARAGFGRDLCAIGRRDVGLLKEWRERLQNEIRTNASKLFSRKNGTLVIPNEFPNKEVLGYYTQPCVSSSEKVAQLRISLAWEHQLDFPNLRSFAADAFDWRNLGGAKKFIRNLAPALLIRRLVLAGQHEGSPSQSLHARQEESLVTAIHGERKHFTTDGASELRISYIPAHFVPIDLSIEPENDEIISSQRGDEADEDAVDGLEPLTLQPSDCESEIPASPTKKTRNMRPYEPTEPEKLWVLREWIQLGHPLMLEEFEAGQRVPKATSRPRRAVTTKPKARPATARSKMVVDMHMPQNAITSHVRTTKATVLQDAVGNKGVRLATDVCADVQEKHLMPVSSFTLPSTQIPDSLLRKYMPDYSTLSRTPAKRQPQPATAVSKSLSDDVQRTPTRRKRRTADLSTPRSGRSAITSYFSPTPKRTQPGGSNIINLVSSSPVPVVGAGEDDFKVPPAEATLSRRSPAVVLSTLYAKQDAILQPIMPLPPSITKRRRRGPMRRSLTAPAAGCDDTPELIFHDNDVECLDLASTSSDIENLPLQKSQYVKGGHLLSAIPQQVSIAVEQFNEHTAHVHETSAAGSLASPAEESGLSVNLPEDQLAVPLGVPRKLHITPRVVAELQPVRRKIMLRESLDGAWADLSADAVDLTGDGSGPKATSKNGRSRRVANSKHAEVRAWRKSGVEVLDLTST